MKIMTHIVGVMGVVTAIVSGIGYAISYRRHQDTSVWRWFIVESVFEIFVGIVWPLPISLGLPIK